MPAVKSLFKFNHNNQVALITELEKIQEPMYFAKNRASSVVVMDAEAFDRALSFRDDVYAREMRVYEGLMRGYEEYQQGKYLTAEEADEKIRLAKGWSY